MIKKTKVYIASPYTNGWQASNVRLQMKARHILMDKGYAPFVPLENHFASIFHERAESEWFDWDLQWLMACDVLVRIRPVDKEGNEIPSTGADMEMDFAREHNIPCYEVKDLKELEEWADSYKAQRRCAV